MGMELYRYWILCVDPLLKQRYTSSYRCPGHVIGPFTFLSSTLTSLLSFSITFMPDDWWYHIVVKMSIVSWQLLVNVDLCA